MTYFDGFVAPVAADAQDAFVAHARHMDPLFVGQGAVRAVENWSDDLPEGKVTDFRKAVQAEAAEAVVFSWIEWPDKATRDAGMAKLMTDPQMNAMPMPFDGKRMIYGGFAALIDERAEGDGAYTDGFVVPVPTGSKDAYRDMSLKAWPVFPEYGATRHVEAWGDDVPEGKVTDFRRAVQAEDGETVVFSFISWPDKATRDAAWAKMMTDERMKPDGPMPFDGKRMFWGGFHRILTLDA
jgi:uncharacterized protein YbaA (DUF1428 family)